MWLMLGIALDEGIPVSGLASWYDRSVDEVKAWIQEFDTEPIIVSIASREGVDFDLLAKQSGMGRRTIVDWFEALESKLFELSADLIQRDSQRRSGPLLDGTTSRVHYLDYVAIQEHGWSIDDEDLFKKASEAGLKPGQFGRVLVSAGETIREAAENRGTEWPYAYRGGAWANCAAIVKEGVIAMPSQTILTDDQIQRMNTRLTCVGPRERGTQAGGDCSRAEVPQELRPPLPMIRTSTTR